jgi:hypothetical protein
MNALNYFAPQIFRELGITGKSGDLFATGIIGVVKLLAVIPAILYVDRFGRYDYSPNRRRMLYIIGTTGMVITIFYVGVFYQLDTLDLIDAQGSELWRCAVLFVCGI